MTETKPPATQPPGKDQPGEQPAPGKADAKPQPSGERGGPKGPEPTRYGDWEKGGRCFDF